MGETLSIIFERRENDTCELVVKESWSGRTVRSRFVSPYTKKQLKALQKRLNSFTCPEHELQAIGRRLFSALCASDQVHGPHSNSAMMPVQLLLHALIQRTLKRRGTVALTLLFGPGCDEFACYPWELLHNGDFFLLGSGIFTLTRALLRPDIPLGCELPVHPPFRLLYVGASPTNSVSLETEQSFEALIRGLAPLIETGHIIVDRLEPATFDQLVRYFSLYGGSGMFDDNETTLPCYVVHFDGHGAYGRLCPNAACETINEAEARLCHACGRSLSRIKAQTYLAFCDDEGGTRFIDTSSLRDLLVSSDVRLAVFSACETAALTGEDARTLHGGQTVMDATLATALVTAQVPNVVAMPFALQDDLSPIFIYHFYEALAEGRTLEEALSRARQAMLPGLQKSWFIPVLYRHIVEEHVNPVPLLVHHDAQQEHSHPLAHLGVASTFVGRETELSHIETLLTTALADAGTAEARKPGRLKPGSHYIALTGPTGIGKSALAFEAVRRNRDKFPGGILGVSLQEGKHFHEAVAEILHGLRVSVSPLSPVEHTRHTHLALGTLRSLASRELPCLLLLDGFEEVKDRTELGYWLHFFRSLPAEVVVMVTSHANPETLMIAPKAHCRWYEYPVEKMAERDLLMLFTELASANGLYERIHLDGAKQQEILHEICTSLDGYPLGAELIFGAARSIGGKVYTPEAATRPLEEVRDELRTMPLAGICAALEVAYRHLSDQAQKLLPYLAAFEQPFKPEHIMRLVAPAEIPALAGGLLLSGKGAPLGNAVRETDPSIPAVKTTPLPDLARSWPAARDELVQTSFLQFDGCVYTIHPQIRSFAFSLLPLAERRKLRQRVTAYNGHVSR